MKRYLFLTILILSISMSGTEVSGQKLMNRLKKVAEKEAEDAINKRLGIGNKSDVPENKSVSEPATGRQPVANAEINANAEVNANTGRKKIKPPDVKKNISDAGSTFSGSHYRDTRYHLEQALIGVEAEIGYQILNSLPESIKSYNYDKEYDQVYVSGVGFTGMDIKRTYFDDSKEAEVSILSSSLIAMPLMMGSSGYSEGQKPIRVNGYEGRLEAREDGSYYIYIPIGQETVFTFQSYELNDEDEVMQFAENFDLDTIKSMLGEQ